MNKLKQTLFRLTVQYSLIFFAFIWLLSGGIYFWVNNSLGEGYVNRINNTLEQQHSTPKKQIELSDSTAGVVADVALDQLRNILIVVNGIALVVVPILAYFVSRRTLIPLVESQKAQQRFVAYASHELRTPLAVMLADLDWAAKKQRSLHEYQTTITNTRGEVKQMTELVTSLLLLARLNDRMTVDKKSLSLSDLVQAATRYYDQAAKEQHITFDVELRADTVHGDVKLLATVIRNLIDNAVKYSPEHTAVIVRSEPMGRKVHISVRNKAKGLDARQLTHIFDRFYQSDVHQSDAGFGLGLAITQQIVEAHGGSIEAHLANDDFEINLVV